MSMSRRVLAICLLAAVSQVVWPALAAHASVGTDGGAVSATPRELLDVPAGFDGSGVQVGVIDSGIAVESGPSRYATNPCFTDTGLNPVEQSGETAYTNNKVTIARTFAAGAQPLYPNGPVAGVDLDAEALSLHGSHVAGIIACNPGTIAQIEGTDVPLQGIAPAATLGSYNLFPGLPVDGVGPTDDVVARAIDAAVSDGMDILNLSLGQGRSPARAAGRAIDEAWQRGVITVVAAGNDGHSEPTLGSPANNAEAITVGSLDTGWAIRASIMLDGQSLPGSTGDGVTVEHPISGALVAVAASANSPANQEAADRMPNPLSLGTGCRTSDFDAASSAIALVARGDCPFAQKIDRAAKAGALAVVVANFDDADLTPIATGHHHLPAVVVTLSVARRLATSTGDNVELAPPALLNIGHTGQISDFSSSGPTTRGLSKPDVVAPGAGIVSASAGADCGQDAVCFAMESGTSMAAPAVAGVAALVRSAHPDWTAAMVRSSVIHTAVPLPDVSVREQGVGRVSATRALSARLGLGVTGVALRDGKTTTVDLINPTNQDAVVDLTVTPAPRDRLRGDYRVTSSVTVPAHGTAPATVEVSHSEVGAAAILTATDATGYAIRAVISTLRK